MISVGFYEEMNMYNNNGPIKESLVESVNYNKKKVIEYIKNNKVVGICARPAIDCITGEEISSGFQILNDGEYEWADFLAYHIAKYNLTLPKAFLEKINAYS